MEGSAGISVVIEPVPASTPAAKGFVAEIGGILAAVSEPE